MPREAFEEVVGVFHKGDDGEIRLKVGVGRSGQPFIDLRHYWLPPNGSDELVPTKRGIRLHAENIDAIVEALRRGDEALKERRT